jgi:hypothetical protein
MKMQSPTASCPAQSGTPQRQSPGLKGDALSLGALSSGCMGYVQQSSRSKKIPANGTLILNQRLAVERLAVASAENSNRRLEHMVMSTPDARGWFCLPRLSFSRDGPWRSGARHALPRRPSTDTCKIG